MTDNCIWKRPAVGFLAAGLVLGLVILPCGCRPSPAFAYHTFESTVISLNPVSEENEAEPSQQILYEEPDLSVDDKSDTQEIDTDPEIQEDEITEDEDITNLSGNVTGEFVEPVQEIPEEPEQEAPVEELEQKEQEEEPETVSGAEVTGNTSIEEPEPSLSTALADGVVRGGDNGVSSYYIQLATDAYQQAPQWVRTLFENSGWHICLRSGSYFGAAYGYNASLLGLTVYGEGNIYISAQEAACNRHIICHELGHFIDSWYGWPSSTSEFSGIYNSEYSAFCSYFGYSNGYPTVNELFAEALYHYLTDPGNLVQAAPRTYAYILNVIG